MAMKAYFQQLIYEILVSTGLEGDRLDQTAATMALSFGALSDEEYGAIMQAGFGGGDLTPVQNFINNSYSIDEEAVQLIAVDILKDSNKWQRDNLPALGLNDN